MITPHLTASREKTPDGLFPSLGGGKEKAMGDKNRSFAPLLNRFENQPRDEEPCSIEQRSPGEIALSVKINFSVLLEDLTAGLSEEGFPLSLQEDELLASSFEEPKKGLPSAESEVDEDLPSPLDFPQNVSSAVEGNLPPATTEPSTNHGEESPGEQEEKEPEPASGALGLPPTVEMERGGLESKTSEISSRELKIPEDGADRSEDAEKGALPPAELPHLSKEGKGPSATRSINPEDTLGMTGGRAVAPSAEEQRITEAHRAEPEESKGPIHHATPPEAPSQRRQGVSIEEEEKIRPAGQPEMRESPFTIGKKADDKGRENQGKDKKENNSSMSGREHSPAAAPTHRVPQSMESPWLERRGTAPDFSKALTLAGRGSAAMEDGIHNVVRFMRGEGLHKAAMIVEPPALGRVEIELASTIKGVEASIRVANEELRALVQDQIAQLRTHLHQLGVQTTEFTVDIHDHGGERGQNRGDGAKSSKARGLDGDEDFDDDTPTFRVDLEQGLLHWVA